ncbi:type II secretion system F family protein [Homoserinibacter sp. GY 40078]|uniref:type II secretion system F family protein n=1 Tax=Homoserinibacter sp. GY 40078 TaxID=2603275 RepID=UPI001650586A|nr:type II secretion system F family protein [Homoserinibacter sp. GY 40078]
MAAAILERAGPPVLAILAVLACVVGAAALPERALAVRARRRAGQISAELPTVLEFMSLAISAGESLRDAIRRVARSGSGELANELAGVVADLDLGVPLAGALRDWSSALQIRSVTRVVDQVVTALDRGTPLTEILREHAREAREDAQRALVESAGRKEVYMLVPLVFLILPVTIVFAIFPATLVLELGF